MLRELSYTFLWKAKVVKDFFAVRCKNIVDRCALENNVSLLV